MLFGHLNDRHWKIKPASQEPNGLKTFKEPNGY